VYGAHTKSTWRFVDSEPTRGGGAAGAHGPNIAVCDVDAKRVPYIRYTGTKETLAKVVRI